MPVLDFSDQAVADKPLDFSASAEGLPDFSGQAIPEERAAKKTKLLAQQRTAQRHGRLADVAVGAATIAEGVGQGLSQANPITMLPRLAFEVDRKLGFVPETQENPIDANRPLVTPENLRDLTALSLPEPGTTGEGVKQFAAEFVSGLTSPNMLAAIATGGAKGVSLVTDNVRKLLGPAFAGDVISHAPEAYQDYLQALKGGDQAEIAKSALNLTATVVIPAAITRHAVKATRPSAPPDELPPLREAELSQRAADTALESTLPLSAKAVRDSGGRAEPIPPGYTTDLGGPIEPPKPNVEPIKPQAEVPRPAAVEAPAPAPAAEAAETPRPQERAGEAVQQEAVVRDVEPAQPTPPAAAEAKIQAEVNNVAETEGLRPTTELARTAQPAADYWERARRGDETAWSDLEQEFRDRLGEPEPKELAAGSGGRHRVHTAEAFERLFNDAYKDRDFDRILTAVKASELSVYKPLIQKFFKAQKADTTAAAKAEWMRAVFNGTRPADAKPPKASAAAPTPGPTPPPPKPQPGGTGSSAPPPAPPPQRIPVSPIPGGGAKSPSVILEDFARAIGKAIKVRRQRSGTLGTYAPGSTLTTERFSGDLDTAAHELAGHWVDDKYGIAKPWFKAKARSPYDSELAKFWIHGSATPGMSLRYKRAEGVAEFVRAYVMNPAEAMKEAPLFGAYFERTIPPEGLKAVRDFSNDVRRWAGEDPLRAGGLDIRMEPPGLKERLWRAFTGRGFGFEISPIDRLRQMFDDPYHFAVKGFHEAAGVRGKNTPLTLEPRENFELMARLLATHDSRLVDQFERGLVSLEPKQIQGLKGLEVERLKDPVTQKPMTLEWLMEPFDKTSVQSMKAAQLDTAAYMVAQRTLEKSTQTGKQSGISGAGHGIYTDVNRSRELLARVATDPALKTRLEEGARRYRLWADQNINLLVESGRLSLAQARDIRDRNEFYVDMHRLSEEFDFSFRQQRKGGAIGSGKQPIQKFKGSTLEVNNVYANLLSQTDAIQKEAHRNMVVCDYTDMLTSARQMHQGPVVDLDNFGSRARAGDRNTIPVYRNGKAEDWKYDPEIYSSLKGLGELGSSPIWTAINAPQRLLRYMITHGPGFVVRNVIKDTFQRTIVSRNKSKPWDILKGFTQEDISRYEVFGGGQFGHYIRDRTTWNRVMKDKMREMSDDPTNIFLAPQRLWQGWSKLAQESEKLGRIAEFRRAFERGKKEFNYDDYNAALYAAGEARGLMDFAKMGTVMRHVNQAIPFSNAAIRGLARDFTAARENPTGFAIRWTLAVGVPTALVLLWNRQDEETWKEYQQLPAYLKDMFWNIKVGNYWLRAPKPHLLGVLASGAERAFLRAAGDEKAFEGFTKSLDVAVLPVNDAFDLAGPLKIPLEIASNHDSFRKREIVPFYESQLKPELRKGEKHSSKAGLGIAQVLRAAGLTTDARQVDHVLNSYGGLGQIVTGFTDSSQLSKDAALRATGLVVQSPTTAARDYQWVMDWARKNGQVNSAQIRHLASIRNQMFEAKDPAQKQLLGKQLREYASEMRKAKE